jgi:hypothetical protein
LQKVSVVKDDAKIELENEEEEEEEQAQVI